MMEVKNIGALVVNEGVKQEKLIEETHVDEIAADAKESTNQAITRELSSEKAAALEPHFEGDLHQLEVYLEDLERAMVVSPNQLKAFLENFYRSVDDSKIVFPKGMMMNKTDIGGFTITDVIKKLLKELGERKEAPGIS